MDVPAVPDPARRLAETNLPVLVPRLATPLVVIAGGAETTAGHGELRAVPESPVDDRVADA